MDELELKSKVEEVVGNLTTSLDYCYGENPMVVFDNRDEVVNELVKLFSDEFNRAHAIGMEVGRYQAHRA